MARPFSIVVWGATGFTGGLVCEYLAKNAPSSLNWAIGGRSKEKLVAVRDKLVPIRSTLSELPILIGDVGDQQSIDAIVKQTKVLISTAGPFARVGLPVVSACARLGTHYVDSTGEPWFIRDCIDKYDELAKKNNALIVPACGFDCIPSDIGAFMTVAFLKEKSKGGNVEWMNGNFLHLDGSMSGGTLETMGSVREQPFATLKQMGHPYYLSPGMKGPPKKGPSESRPRYDPTINAWVTPFVLSGTNMRVVRRSASLLSYGPNFRYLEANKTSGMLVAWTLFLIQQLFVLLLFVKLTKSLLTRLVLPAPGQGPSREKLAKAKFTLQLIGQTEPAQDGSFVKARAVVAGGDPGYLETAKMISESALAISLQYDKLPQKSGVLTPAAAFGSVLIERLRAAGMTFEVATI